MALINDVDLLSRIKSSCFTQDTRASWVGAGIASTDNPDYKGYANWANQHLSMYLGFLSFIELKEPKILDIGCGSGFATFNLTEYIKDVGSVDALDYDSGMICFANEFNSNSKINYIADNFLTCGLIGKYNYIFALEILEHLNAEDHYVFVDKALSLLEEDGLLFLSTPNEPNGVDCHHHRGLLNRQRSLDFYTRYRKNIVDLKFFDNQKLNVDNLNEFIIQDDFYCYDREDDINRSHFAFVMRRV